MSKLEKLISLFKRYVIDDVHGKRNREVATETIMRSFVPDSLPKVISESGVTIREILQDRNEHSVYRRPSMKINDPKRITFQYPSTFFAFSERYLCVTLTTV